MNKLELMDLPDSVQLKAADCLMRFMEVSESGKWVEEAKLISAAFLAMYESTEVKVTIQGAVTVTDTDLAGVVLSKLPGSSLYPRSQI